MNRTFYNLFYCTLIILLGPAGISWAVTFDFNDGTAQGWSMDGAYIADITGGPYTHGFISEWDTETSYPNAPGLDPVGNLNGSYCMRTIGVSHGISGAAGNWWIMQLKSPDLSTDTDWQNCEGYSVQIAECMVSLGSDPLYANLFVKIYDHDLMEERYFYNGVAQPLTHCNYVIENIWNSETFNWTSQMPSNYTVLQIHINIWGQLPGPILEGGLHIDEVTPLILRPFAPTNLDVNKTLTQLHVTWEDNASNEDGFVIQYKVWPRLGSEPPTWNELDTVGPDVTSYQMNGPLMDYYYKFRVYAYNEHGNSVVSNEETILTQLSLDFVRVDSPNGGESFAQGSIQTIEWGTGWGITDVKIEYSTDGGSNWISPPITSSTPDDGEYDWTVPAILSDNCILKITDAADGTPYDLSDTPFSIVAPAPDLVIESLTCDQQNTALQDTNLDFHCTVRNVGSVASGSFYIDFYPDYDVPPVPGQYGTLWHNVSTLDPGTSHTWNFSYLYAIPDILNAYAQVDAEASIAEADENNNVAGLQGLKVHEFEFIKDTSNTKGLFGYDQSADCNIGIGQSFILPRSAYVSYTGLRFSSRFDYNDSPSGTGHAVNLMLDVRDDSGTVVKSVMKQVLADFTGGWVQFNLDMDLWAGREYIFTCYVLDGEINELSNGFYARTDNPWPDSIGYKATDYSPFNIEDWSSWNIDSLDFNFRIAGWYTDLSPADFNRSYLVNLADYSYLAQRWLDSCILPGWCNQADTDYSGDVDEPDLECVGADWLWTGYGSLDRTGIFAMAGQLSEDPISGSDGEEFRTGAYFVYVTEEERYGKCIAEEYDMATHELMLGWTTYNADGTIYSTGTGLVIQSGMTYDLDTGQETTSGEDFWWQQGTTTTRYLVPEDGAMFQLVYRAP